MARITLTVLVSAFALSACGSSSHATSQHTSHAKQVTITIGGYAFHPPSLTVSAGTRVSFVNHDVTAHTATATGNAPAFDTGTLNPHAARTVTLNRAGTYTYYCQFHAFMRATIRVVAP